MQKDFRVLDSIPSPMLRSARALRALASAKKSSRAVLTTPKSRYAKFVTYGIDEIRPEQDALEMSISNATFYAHDYAFDISSKEELMSFFRERDQQHVIVRRDFEFPMRIQYYFTWSESSGVYRYLLFKKPGWEMPIGLVFRHASGTSPEGATGGICDWCHTYGTSNQIGLLTTAINSKRTVGLMLCLDLSCGDKIETAPSQSGKSPEARILETCERIGRFFDDTIRPNGCKDDIRLS